MEIAVFLFTTLVLVCYALFLFEAKETTPLRAVPLKKVKIVVPYKNEAHRISSLLHDLVREFSQVDSVQIFFVDDGSNDRSASLIEEYLADKDLHYLLLRNFGNGKKSAIETASQFCSLNDFILTLDADVRLPLGYASELKKLKVANGLNVLSLDYPAPTNAMQAMVKLESIFQKPLFGSTPFGIKPALCSGAHLMYPTHFFEHFQPYQTNKELASGDDMFFLDACLRHKTALGSCKLSVLTEYPSSWRSLFLQRSRWLSKTPKLKSWYYHRFTVLFSILLFWPLVLAVINPLYCLMYFAIRAGVESVYLGAKKSLKLVFILPFYWLLQYGMPLLYIFGRRQDEQTW